MAMMDKDLDMQFQFNYLDQFCGSRQLYYDYQLWYQHDRENYWQCTKCKCYISTMGDALKNPNAPLPTHSHEGKLNRILSTYYFCCLL